MSIGKNEVMDILEDGRLGHIRFSYGRIRVNTTEYQKVVDHIDAGTIRIVSATLKDGTAATYNTALHTIKVSKKVSWPPDNIVRSTIVHECTHAIIDINKWSISVLENEAIAYLAKYAYLLLLNPSAEDTVLRGDPEGTMTIKAMQLVRQYQIGKPAGFEAKILASDIEGLARLVGNVPLYYQFSSSQMTPDLGVPENRKFRWLQAQRILSESPDYLIAAGIEWETTMDVEGVSRESYVTWDPELICLIDLYKSSVAKQRTIVLQKLIRIFSAIDRNAALILSQRLSTLRKGDRVSERFNKLLPTDVTAALLLTLK